VDTDVFWSYTFPETSGRSRPFCKVDAGSNKVFRAGMWGSESSVLWSLSFVKKMVRGGVGGTGDPQTLL